MSVNKYSIKYYKEMSFQRILYREIINTELRDKDRKKKNLSNMAKNTILLPQKYQKKLIIQLRTIIRGNNNKNNNKNSNKDKDKDRSRNKGRDKNKNRNKNKDKDQSKTVNIWVHGI